MRQVDEVEKVKNMYKLQSCNTMGHNASSDILAIECGDILRPLGKLKNIIFSPGENRVYLLAPSSIHVHVTLHFYQFYHSTGWCHSYCVYYQLRFPIK